VRLVPSNAPTCRLRSSSGIKLLRADDFKTWLLSIEVMGESSYKVIINLERDCHEHSSDRCLL
jgi:hypothetical protein